MRNSSFQRHFEPDAKLQAAFVDTYGDCDSIVLDATHRFSALIDTFKDNFGSADVSVFDTPGRVEIGGNHTDHNNGRVLAAAVGLDSIAVAACTSDDKVTLISEGYDETFKIDLGDLDPRHSERGTTNALMRGIAARFKQLGYVIGGFNACISSRVLPGSGLSSSASIEVLVGSILNHLYNNGGIDPITIAQIGQFAENLYFDKPCGLMDQIACAVGGMVAIDFADPQHPVVERIDFDFSNLGCNLLVVDTGGSHSDLTEHYAAVASEMKMVANVLGQDVLRSVDKNDLLNQMPRLREEIGDRPMLRALHFVGENHRVQLQVEALKGGDVRQFLYLVEQSGRSSCARLQNCFTGVDTSQQGVLLGLALSEMFLELTNSGACRIHGGGFAGTILIFMPDDLLDDYIPQMESVFGNGSVMKLDLRSVGTTCLGQLKA